MGCGKSKHDVVTGNTKTVRKPSEAESVKGKESERQESRDVSAVDNNTETADEKDNVRQTEVKEEAETTTSSPPETVIVAENIVAVNNVTGESHLPIDEQEKVEVEAVVEEERITEGKNDGDVDTEIPVPEPEEPKSDVEIPVATELQVEEDLSTENNQIPDDEKVDAVEEKSADTAKEVESA